MIEPKTVVRVATLRDILDVAAAMRATERGSYDLECFAQVTGSPVDDRFVSQLGQYSMSTVALVEQKLQNVALVVAGFIQQRPGVLRTWMLATAPAWREHGAELTRYTALGIAAQLDYGARRIETICPDSHTAAKAWYPRLGLKQESTLAKYCTDGSDAALFVRLRGDV